MTTQPTHLSVEEIERGMQMLKSATRAPWFTVQSPWRRPDIGTWIVAGSPDPQAGTPVLNSMDIDEWPADTSGPDYTQSDADLELVAWLRNHAPALLAAATRDAEAKWIPVTERLPDTQRMVLLHSPHSQRGTVQYGFYGFTGGSRPGHLDWFTWTTGGWEPVAATGDPVTHWQPLPSPPDSIPKG